MEAEYSNVAGELVGALFTSDPAVLDSATILSVIAPTKMRVAWLQLLADGLDDAASLTSKRFRDTSAIRSWLASTTPPWLVATW
jgi:hypothetical protein